MTEQTPVIHPMPTVVDPHGNGRLAQLHAAYPEAKAQADAATERLKEITDGIKAELFRLAPDQVKVDLRGTSGPALRLSYTETWRFDSKRFKVEHPVEYVAYAAPSGSWRLAVVKDGDEG